MRTKSLESRLQEVAAGVAYNSVTKQLQVRGVTSLMANAAPLVVLDGLPFEGTLDQINPSTVRSVTVRRGSGIHIRRAGSQRGDSGGNHAGR